MKGTRTKKGCDIVLSVFLTTNQSNGSTDATCPTHYKNKIFFHCCVGTERERERGEMRLSFCLLSFSYRLCLPLSPSVSLCVLCASSLPFTRFYRLKQTHTDRSLHTLSQSFPLSCPISFWSCVLWCLVSCGDDVAPSTGPNDAVSNLQQSDEETRAFDPSLKW